MGDIVEVGQSLIKMSSEHSCSTSEVIEPVTVEFEEGTGNNRLTEGYEVLMGGWQSYE